MDYVVRQGEDRTTVSVRPISPGQFVLCLGGREVLAEVEDLGPGGLLIALPNEGGARFVAQIEAGRVCLGEWELSGEVFDLRTLALEEVQARSGADCPQLITTPMPGRVAAVLVAEGQEVNEGDGLVVVEAMKMENELRAPRAGVVRGLAAIQGASVAGGAILCAVH